MAVASILLEEVSFTYPDGQVALQGVSLEVPPDETLNLINPNGAGKSTLLLHLNGPIRPSVSPGRSEEHTSELQSQR